MTNSEQASYFARIFGLDSRKTVRYTITHGEADTIAALIDSTGLGAALGWILDGSELVRVLYVSSEADGASDAADRDWTAAADRAAREIARLREDLENSDRDTMRATVREIEKLKTKDAWASQFEGECYE
jgi:hypothetical protein